MQWFKCKWFCPEKCISNVKIYLLERCPLDSSEVVLDCTLGALELDFLLSGGLYPLCFACPKCDLSAENQNRYLSGKWDANTVLKVKYFFIKKKKTLPILHNWSYPFPKYFTIKLLLLSDNLGKEITSKNPLKTKSLDL